MGVRNYLVEGVSGTGKTSVYRELSRRGYQAINGDRVLAYQGDPETGEATDTNTHQNHIWDLERVRALAADRQEQATFFCGGSRNFTKFIELFDETFVLDIDLETLHSRLDQRPQGEWGSKPSERDLVVRLHRTQEDIPHAGVVIDATQPLDYVVDEILQHAGLRDDDVPDLQLVTRLLREQAPQLATMPVRASPTSGSSNWVFRIGDTMSIRLPRSDDYVVDLANEVRWLPRLAPQLPVPVPDIVAVGQPSETFARPWAEGSARSARRTRPVPPTAGV